MKTKHTPGPWRVDTIFWGDIETKSGTLQICTVDCEEDKKHAFKCPTIQEAKANARLIAAAPELLEALEGIMDRPDFDWNIARAAIAKAKGETL